MLTFLLYFCLILIIFCLSPFVLAGVVLIIMKLKTRWNTSPVCLNGKTVIVTGANSGIGFYTAREFATRGAKVILACRSIARAEEAKTIIIESTKNSNVHVRIIDFNSLKSVRRFAQEIHATEERIDILVNNAGNISDDKITDDGISETMQVNSLGPFLLTILLMDLLKKSTSSRIINVASLTVYYAKIPIDDLNYYSKSIIARVSLYNYGNAKLCNLVLMNEMARRLKRNKKMNVTINSVDPGIAYTGITRDWNFLGRIMYICVQLFLRNAKQGAQSSIYMALSRSMEKITGMYIMNSAITKAPSIANDQAFAEQLWNKCMKLLQLSNKEYSIVQTI